MYVQNWIIRWFVENTHATEAELLEGLGNNYFDKGWIDSMAFISLLGDVEENFGVEFDSDAFEDRAFSTINGMARILEGMTA